MSQVNTPGVGGYLLAWLVSALAFSMELALLAGKGLGVLLDVSVAMVLLLVLLSVPFAVAGILVVHLSCRRVEAQSVHVLAAGAFGWACLGLVPLQGAEPEGFLVGLALGGPAALGRLAVVPLVWRRRNWVARAMTG